MGREGVVEEDRKGKRREKGKERRENNGPLNGGDVVRGSSSDKNERYDGLTGVTGYYRGLQA